MWPIRNETAASKRFLSWPNRVLAIIWNAISALERFFYIATETAFWILAQRTQQLNVYKWAENIQQLSTAAKILIKEDVGGKKRSHKAENEILRSPLPNRYPSKSVNSLPHVLGLPHRKSVGTNLVQHGTARPKHDAKDCLSSLSTKRYLLA